MKFLFLSIFLVISLNTLGQQNLFNIPSGDLTPKGKWFYQHQTNFYQGIVTESKNHFVYGLGKGWEAGLNIQNLKVNWQETNGNRFVSNTNNLSEPMQPLVQFATQKFFQINDKFKTTLGTQIGVNPIQFSQNPHLTHYTYNTWVYEPTHHYKLVVGPYISDRRTIGSGTNVGMMVGFELPIHKKALLMGDWISGTNSASAGVVGINYYLSKRVQLCLGGLIPNANSGNKSGVVFELNLLGFDDN